MVFKGLPEGIHWSKRLFDFVFAGLGLFLLSPIILIIAILILILEGRPVFFKQERPGLHGEIFAMYKFRTMKCLKKHGREFPPDKRISRIGAFLRITSLDELPELINVLRGEMSLVGPRPLLVQYLKRYNNHQRRRHNALPGITGWAQVNGRNVQTWKQRFDFDVWYVDNWSFWLDLDILLKTLIIVVKHDDVSPTDGKIMEEFQGNPRPPRHERIPVYAMRKPSNPGLTAKTTGQTLASKPSLQ